LPFPYITVAPINASPELASITFPVIVVWENDSELRISPKMKMNVFLMFSAIKYLYLKSVL